MKKFDPGKELTEKLKKEVEYLANYQNEHEIKLVHIDTHRAMFLRFDVEREAGYKKRHEERLAKIKEIEAQDGEDFNETADKICFENYGCSAIDYMSGKGDILPKWYKDGV